MKYDIDVNTMIFKRVSARDYLQILRGVKCTDRERESIHGLQFKYLIQDEVLNVILHYLIIFKKLVPPDKTLEEYVTMCVDAGLSSSEQTILFFRDLENERKLEKERIHKEVFNSSTELVKVHGFLDQTYSSFKNRCSIEQKRELSNVMNRMIKDAFNKTNF